MREREAAFREAIEAEPDDDGVRLAFADWLASRDDARAGAIRTRCEQIGRIKQKLARLRAEDATFTHFGARWHRYQHQVTPDRPEPI